MKRPILLLTALAVLAVGGAAWLAMAGGGRSEWTTSSSTARRELERGLDASRKYYVDDALEHYRAALEADPDFAIAALNILLSPYVDRQERYELRRRLEEVDTTTLTPREELLIRYHLSHRTEDDRGEGLLDRYLEAHPLDPYALELECTLYWEDGKLDRAEDCYERLLEVEPNWVSAQNRLGYLAMGQGRLDLAEDRFRTYRYVAPDQANPHDSLGELLILRGRFDEARSAFQAALEVRPDFCTSYANLVDLALYSDSTAGLEQTLAQLEEHANCEEEWGDTLRCRAELTELYLGERWEELAVADCIEDEYGLLWLAQFGALMSGAEDRCHLLTELYAEVIRGRGQDELDNPMLLHMRAQQSGHEGRLAEAVEYFYLADAKLDYWGQRRGMLKLYNLAAMTHALRAMGKERKADKVVAEIESINPVVAELLLSGEMPSPIVSP